MWGLGRDTGATPGLSQPPSDVPACGARLGSTLTPAFTSISDQLIFHLPLDPPPSLSLGVSLPVVCPPPPPPPPLRAGPRTSMRSWT